MKKIKIIGLFFLFTISTIYSYKKPSSLKVKKKHLIVYLEGYFNQTGEVEIEENMTFEKLINKIGIKKQGNLKAINLKLKLIPETRYYLPKKRKHAISLNKANKETFMTLKGIGEATYQKIDAYRKQKPFNQLEDIMLVEGIGEKRYLAYRDYLIL